MPSPSKRYSQRNSPSRNRGNFSDNEVEQRKNPPELLNNGPSSSRGVKFSADGSTTSRLPSSSNTNQSSSNNNNEERMDIGKRTGIQIPARGTSQSIPINNDGYEDLDKFFAAGTSPAPPGLSYNASTNNNSAAARGGGNKKQSDKEQRNQEKHVRHEELLKEGNANARQRPELLNHEQVSRIVILVMCGVVLLLGC